MLRDSSQTFNKNQQWDDKLGNIKLHPIATLSAPGHSVSRLYTGNKDHFLSLLRQLYPQLSVPSA